MAGPGRARWRWFVLSATALALAFAWPLADLFRFSLRSALYSHLFLVPAISVYLTWLERRRLGAFDAPARGISLALVAMAVVLLGGYALARAGGWTVARQDYLSLMTCAFVCLLIAAAGQTLGRGNLRVLAFPSGFLLLMAPLPLVVERALESALQHGSADAAGILFAISGTTFYREGTLFTLPGVRLEVAPECSGIHSTLVLLVTALLAGHIFLRRAWAKGALVASVLLIGILRNAFRILVLGQLCIHVSPDILNSELHRRGGPLFFVASLIPFFLFVWILRKLERRRPPAPAEYRHPSSST